MTSHTPENTTQDTTKDLIEAFATNNQDYIRSVYKSNELSFKEITHIVSIFVNNFKPTDEYKKSTKFIFHDYSYHILYEIFYEYILYQSLLHNMDFLLYYIQDIDDLKSYTFIDLVVNIFTEKTIDDSILENIYILLDKHCDEKLVNNKSLDSTQDNKEDSDNEYEDDEEEDDHTQITDLFNSFKLIPLNTTSYTDNTKQLCINIIYKILQWKRLYNVRINLLDAIRCIMKIDDTDILFKVLLNNLYIHNPDDLISTLEDIYLHMITYTKIYNKEIYMTCLIDFLNKHNTKLSIRDIKMLLTDTLWLNLDMDEESHHEDKSLYKPTMDMFKHIHELLSTLNERNIRYIKEEKEDVERLYSNLFHSMFSYELEDDRYFTPRLIFLSIPLDTIQMYKKHLQKDCKEQDTLSYNNIVGIYYLNYRYLNSLCKSNFAEEKETYDIFKHLYIILKDITCIDYSHHNIEEDPLIKRFTYRICSMVEDYLDRDMFDRDV